VLGRKNWLFAGSESRRPSHRHSVFASADLQAPADQFRSCILRDVIERVSTHPARLVLELTPREWKRLRLDPGAQATA